MRWMIAVALGWSTPAWADIDPKCVGLEQPPDYNEQVQADFQANYFALAASQSVLHGPVPHEPGRGSIGVDLKVVPALGCEQRFVLNWTKTEQTNKTPLIPQLAASYSFPAIKDIIVPYAGFSILPAIPLGDPDNVEGASKLPKCDGTQPATECNRKTRSLVMSGEIGVGFKAHERFEAGVRGHATMMRTFGDIATAFDEAEEPSIEDIYSASTWGFDAIFGVPVDAGGQHLVPYVAVGYLNASTYFFIGDDNFVAPNLHPYEGAALSLGLDALFANRLRLAGEFFAAPGGYSNLDPNAPVDQGSRYGRMYTARARVGYEF